MPTLALYRPIPALALLLFVCLCLPLAANAQGVNTNKNAIPLHTGTPDFFAQATLDGVPADFLAARSVAARIVQYNRPLVDMLSELGADMAYRPLRNGHALLLGSYDPKEGWMTTVEYRFTYHPETKEAEITDIFKDGKLLDNYDFYNYADELCRPKRP
ncbi:MAG: hypothetical protein V3573_11980 [Desulfovibrionaceae bacterium]